jgi:hypothetical protein
MLRFICAMLLIFSCTAAQADTFIPLQGASKDASGKPVVPMRTAEAKFFPLTKNQPAFIPLNRAASPSALTAPTLSPTGAAPVSAPAHADAKPQTQPQTVAMIEEQDDEPLPERPKPEISASAMNPDQAKQILSIYASNR